MLRIDLEACSSCREMASRFRRVIGVLPLSVAKVAPPARLRERILSAAEASRSPAVPGGHTGAKDPVRLPRHKLLASRSGGRWSIYSAAAGIVLALLVGLVAGDLIGRGAASSAPSQVARVSLTGHHKLAGASASVIDFTSHRVALINFNGIPHSRPGRSMRSGSSPPAVARTRPEYSFRTATGARWWSSTVR